MANSLTLTPLARGIDRIDTPYVSQVNGIMRYHGRRNHPRVVQGPHGAVYFGANNDTQFALHNGFGLRVLEQRGRDGYTKYLNNLSAAGYPSLDHWNASQCLNRYATGYSCKGDANPAEWLRTREQLTDRYCNDPGNDNKTFRNVVAKHMSEIASGMNVSKDQALYCISGGMLKRSSMGNQLKCSVTSIEVSELGEDELNCQAGEDTEEASAKGPKNSFTWKKALLKYTKRPDSEEMNSMNLFRFITFNWKKDMECVPIFYGYSRTPSSWPLTEEFSKWTLAIYKPFRRSYEEHIHPDDNSYTTTLLEFMWDGEQCPGTIRADILRVQRKEEWQLDLPQGQGAFANHLTPSDDMVHAPNEEAAQVAANQLAQAPPMITDGADSLDGVEFRIRTMNKRADGHDWSANYDANLARALVEYSTQYYRASRADTIDASDGDEEPLALFQEHIYCPENAVTESQKLLIFHHLLCQKELLDYMEAPNKEGLRRPPDRRVLVEGLPGVGKSWITKTLRNINRQLHKSNAADMATTPTGCSAALVDGKTHFRALAIVPGKSFKMTTTNMSESNKQKILEAKIRMCSVVSWFMDEHSMTGREMWAWLNHRAEELRRPQAVIPRERDGDSDDELEGVPPGFHYLGGRQPILPRCL